MQKHTETDSELKKGKRTIIQKEMQEKRLKFEEIEEGEILFSADSLKISEVSSYTSFSDTVATTSKTCDFNYEYHAKQVRYEQKKSNQRFKQMNSGKFYRGWQKIYSNIHNQAKMVFRVASYNLLAPQLAEQHYTLYRKGNPTYMDWNYRKKKIRDEITKTHADIYCFQEMQNNDYEEFFLPLFLRLGYESIYMKRSGDKVDGCCTCFKKKKFVLINKDLVDYYQPGVPNLERENVGIIILLESTDAKYESKRVCVANTHILYNPKRGDCKLAQLMYFLASIDRIAFREMKLNQKKHAYYPTVMCGDFNMDFRSKLYEFITTSKLNNYRYLNRHLMSGQLETTMSEVLVNTTLLPKELGISDKCQFKSENDKRCPNSTRLDIFGGESLSHCFQFDSVYDHYDRNKNTYEVTTCINEFKRTVDYIFYHSEINDDFAESELNVVARLELLKEHQVLTMNLPCRQFPSDHFMIAADFSI